MHISLPLALLFAALAFGLAAAPAFARIAHNYESVIAEVPEKGPGGESVPLFGGLQDVECDVGAFG